MIRLKVIETGSFGTRERIEDFTTRNGIGQMMISPFVHELNFVYEDGLPVTSRTYRRV